MPRGDKSKYTDKQERKADHIAEGYEKRGVPEQEAERRAWATVNKDDGGGKKAGGSGRGKSTGHPAAHRAVRRAVRPPRRAQQRVVRRLRRRQRPHASGTPSSTPDQPEQGYVFPPARLALTNLCVLSARATPLPSPACR